MKLPPLVFCVLVDGNKKLPWAHGCSRETQFEFFWEVQASNGPPLLCVLVDGNKTPPWTHYCSRDMQFEFFLEVLGGASTFKGADGNAWNFHPANELFTSK